MGLDQGLREISLRKYAELTPAGCDLFIRLHNFRLPEDARREVEGVDRVSHDTFIVRV